MLSQEKINLIHQLYSEGKSKTEIVKITGCAASTIKKYVQDIDNNKVDDMIGKTFGKLIVLSRAPKDNNAANRCIRYFCKCECGNIINVNGAALRSGHTTSCGCSRKGSTIKDLTNQKFGYLTAINYAYSNNNRAIWNCICDCGNKIQVSSHELISGHTTSCGCRKRSNGEEKIENILIELKVNYATEYKIQDCKYKKVLPFDFAIFDKNNNLLCLIEYQGEQHFKSIDFWGGEERFLKQKERDEIKQKYCIQNNIKLIIISYLDYNILNKDYLEKVIYD